LNSLPIPKIDGTYALIILVIVLLTAMKIRFDQIERKIDVQHPLWLRFRMGDPVSGVGSGLLAQPHEHLHKARVSFIKPRSDTSYTVVADVLGEKFYRTFPRISQITTTGFTVTLLTEKNQGVYGYDDLELSVIVIEKMDSY